MPSAAGRVGLERSRAGRRLPCDRLRRVPSAARPAAAHRCRGTCPGVSGSRCAEVERVERRRRRRHDVRAGLAAARRSGSSGVADGLQRVGASRCAGRGRRSSLVGHGRSRVLRGGRRRAASPRSRPPPVDGVAELLLQEPAVRDQRVGVDPDHRVEDLVHGRAEQVELVDQQHQRGLAVLDRPGVGPVAGAAGCSRRSPPAGSRWRWPSPSTPPGCRDRGCAAAAWCPGPSARPACTRDSHGGRHHPAGDHGLRPGRARPGCRPRSARPG